MILDALIVVLIVAWFNKRPTAWQIRRRQKWHAKWEKKIMKLRKELAIDENWLLDNENNSA